MSQNVHKRRMITSALPYANGPIHPGHIAGAYLPADIYVRHLEHGGRRALDLWERRTRCGHHASCKKNGTTPREIVDTYHLEMQKSVRGADISFDQLQPNSSPSTTRWRRLFRPCSTRAGLKWKPRSSSTTKRRNTPGRPVHPGHLPVVLVGTAPTATSARNAGRP